MKVCIYHSFFCNVLIQLQIALQGELKINMMEIMLCVEVDLTMFSVYLSVFVDLLTT